MKLALVLLAAVLLLTGCGGTATYSSTDLGCSFKYPKGFELQSELPTKKAATATFIDGRTDQGQWVTEASFTVAAYAGTSGEPSVDDAKAVAKKALGSSFSRFTQARTVTVGDMRGIVVGVIYWAGGEDWVDETWMLAGPRTYLVTLSSPAADWPSLAPRLREVPMSLRPRTD
ncbi:MAG TPA: hypothetical protein VK576_11730 [Thermoleophilia bacterium]|nr:hypothetical protein [Thermoleophilia bacterium]